MSRPVRYISSPERFIGYRDDIEDEATAKRIEQGQPWRIQHMADRISDLVDASNRFSNSVFTGLEPDYDDLADTIDVAEGAVYEWAKNNARLEGWNIRAAKSGATNE